MKPMNIKNMPYNILRIANYLDIPKYIEKGFKVICMPNHPDYSYDSFWIADSSDYLKDLKISLDDILNKDILNCFYVVLPENYYLSFKKHIYENANGNRVTLVPKNNYDDDSYYLDDSRTIGYRDLQDDKLLARQLEDGNIEYFNLNTCRLRDFIMEYQKCIPNQTIGITFI